MIKLCLSVQPISIHAPREGGDEVTGVIQVIPCTISIHAPREGGDSTSLTENKSLFISIHAPREGGDHRMAVHARW